MPQLVWGPEQFWIRSLRLVGCVKQNVAVYPNRKAVARRHLDGRLNGKIAPRDRRAGIAHVPADGCFGCLGGARVIQNALVLALRDIKCSTEKAAQSRRAKQ